MDETPRFEKIEKKGGMMRRSIVKVLLVGFVAMSLSGCATRLIDFTMISTKNVDFTRGANFVRGKNRVEGIDEVAIIIFIPTGTPNIKEAIDRAIESVPGAVALVDGVVTQKSWYIPYIFGKSSFVVEGTPLIDPSMASAERASNYIVSKMDESGEVQELRYVSKTEFDGLKKKWNL